MGKIGIKIISIWLISIIKIITFTILGFLFILCIYFSFTSLGDIGEKKIMDIIKETAYENFCLFTVWPVTILLIVIYIVRKKYNNSVRSSIIKEILYKLNDQLIIQLQDFKEFPTDEIKKQFIVAEIFKPIPKIIFLTRGVDYYFNTYFEFMKGGVRYTGTEVNYQLINIRGARHPLQSGLIIKTPMNINIPPSLTNSYSTFFDGYFTYLYFPYKRKWNFSLLMIPNYKPLMNEIWDIFFNL